VRELADSLIGTKGVETGRLVLASAMPVTHASPAHSHESGHSHGHTHTHPHTRDSGRRGRRS
jgi:CopG family nickel-responsive transcriptional regulator